MVTRLTVSLDREMRGVVFPSFFDFVSKFCVTNLQYCNFFFTYLIKLDLPHSLITKSGKVITKNMHKTLCVAQNIGSLIRGRQYINHGFIVLKGGSNFLKVICSKFFIVQGQKTAE